MAVFVNSSPDLQREKERRLGRIILVTSNLNETVAAGPWPSAGDTEEWREGGAEGAWGGRE